MGLQSVSPEAGRWLTGARLLYLRRQTFATASLSSRITPYVILWSASCFLSEKKHRNFFSGHSTDNEIVDRFSPVSPVTHFPRLVYQLASLHPNGTQVDVGKHISRTHQLWCCSALTIMAMEMIPRYVFFDQIFAAPMKVGQVYSSPYVTYQWFLKYFYCGWPWFHFISVWQKT